MSAPVLPLQPVKSAPGPAALTPEQSYWKTFKSQLLIPSPANYPITSISAPAAPPNALTLPSDLFAVTTGGRVQFYSSRTRKLVKTISRFSDTAHGADVRYDGRVMVAGDESGAIQVFDIGSRAILKTWNEHKQPVWTTKFSPIETTTLLSASDDRTVRLWDLPSQESTATFAGHEDYVRTAAFMPGKASSLLVSGSYDQTVRLWDPRSPVRAAMIFKHAAPVEYVLPMPSGTTLLAAADNQISVLDLVGGKPLHIIQNHQKTVTSLCLASAGTRLVSGGLDGHVKIFETSGWNVVSGSKYPSPVLSLSIVGSATGRDDKHLVVGMQSGLLSIKTRLSGQQKIKEKAREKEMQALVDGNIEELDRRKAKKMGSSLKRQLRGRDFGGEGADVIIEGNERRNKKMKKQRAWEVALRSAKYPVALDLVLQPGTDLHEKLTLLVALRHRSAMRSALSGRDDESLLPIMQFICRLIVDPRYVPICVEVGMLILDIYSAQAAQSTAMERELAQLRAKVRKEVEMAQQAWQTHGMLELLTAS